VKSAPINLPKEDDSAISRISRATRLPSFARTKRKLAGIKVVGSGRLRPSFASKETLKQLDMGAPGRLQGKVCA
jgi:hypothetical protein